jgi:2-methylisocitrate lyase-like PEP mutase family enzyme
MTSALALGAATFREQNSVGWLLLPNAWDAASARIFEEAGFGAIGTTSAGIAYAEEYRDGEQIGRDAVVRAVAKIVNAVSVPVSADIDGGYGPSASDVAQTVDRVLDVGAVGINLEDTAHYGGSAALLGVAEQCERIAAARELANRRPPLARQV